jgi:hypothetical protein
MKRVKRRGGPRWLVPAFGAATVAAVYPAAPGGALPMALRVGQAVDGDATADDRADAGRLGGRSREPVRQHLVDAPKRRRWAAQGGQRQAKCPQGKDYVNARR